MLQILLTPVTMGLTLFYLVFSRLDPTPLGFAAAAVLAAAGPGHPRHLPPAPAAQGHPDPAGAAPSS